MHLELVEIKRVLQKLINGLKPQGMLFVSFKRGVGRVVESGRPFTLFEEATLRDLLEELTGANVKNLWVSDDQRSLEFRQWVNAVVQKNQ